MAKQKQLLDIIRDIGFALISAGYVSKNRLAHLPELVGALPPKEKIGNLVELINELAGWPDRLEGEVELNGRTISALEFAEKMVSIASSFAANQIGFVCNALTEAVEIRGELRHYSSIEELCRDVASARKRFKIALGVADAVCNVQARFVKLAFVPDYAKVELMSATQSLVNHPEVRKEYPEIIALAATCRLRLSQ